MLLTILASEARGTTAALVGAGTAVVAATVGEKVVWTLRIYDGRDCFGRALLTDPVGLANAVTVLVAAVVACLTAVAR